MKEENNQKTIFWLATDEKNKVAIYIDNNFILQEDGNVKLTDNAENVTVDCIKATAHVLSTLPSNQITFKYGNEIFVLNADVYEANEKNMKKFFPKGDFTLSKE